MPAGEKTVAQRAFVEALVEAGGGVLDGDDRRQERLIEPIAEAQMMAREWKPK